MHVISVIFGRVQYTVKPGIYYNIKFFAVDVATIYNEIIIICLEDCSKLQDDLLISIGGGDGGPCRGAMMAPHFYGTLFCKKRSRYSNYIQDLYTLIEQSRHSIQRSSVVSYLY